MEMSGQLHAPAALPQGKSPWCPLDWRLGGHQSRSGSGGEEKNSQPLPGLEPPIIQPVAQRYTTELRWLTYTHTHTHTHTNTRVNPKVSGLSHNEIYPYLLVILVEKQHKGL
jgi:hypothetical protein